MANTYDGPPAGEDPRSTARERDLLEDRALRKNDGARGITAERRLEFLAGAIGMLSSSSTDRAAAMHNTVRLAVPALADLCFVDLLEPGGHLRRAVADRGSAAEPAQEDEPRRRMDPNLAHGTPRVLRTGRSELLTEVGDDVLKSVAVDSGELAHLRRLGPRSFMCVPLRTPRGSIGAVGFFSGEGSYGERDLALAETLVNCAALALDSAAGHLTEVEMAREILRLSGKESAATPTTGADTDLTRRQLEVLGLMSEGSTARQIGRQLHISEDTVRNHIRAIKTALDASSQLEAIAQARRLGVLPR